MCRNNRKAFWSIDAAFALVLAVAMFAMFSSVLYAASALSLHSAADESLSLLSVRFSSYALLQLEKGEAVDLKWMLLRTGREYASISMSDVDGSVLFASEGERGGKIFCTRRLAHISGKMVKVEACIA